MGITSNIAEKDKAELIKKIYELGFEVGLKNHSEIGWVLREYNDLTSKALDFGIKSPDSYYADGKIKGKASRDKNVEGPKKPEKETAPVRKIVLTAHVVDHEIQKEESGFERRLQKPTLSELPKFVEKGNATEIPAFLEGFKPNKKK